jgi:hypothetical protein
VLTIDDIVHLYETRGSAWYGSEAISQREHALQCALLAQSEGAAPALVAASLLHDIGHLLEPEQPAGSPAARQIDLMHQYIAMPHLHHLFSEAVLEPIRLHVDAKRYLCAVDTGYWSTLSPASKHSLELQGGVFSAQDADNFMRHPHAGDAVLLRRWDDRAKQRECVTPAFGHFLPCLEAGRLQA